ncbi:MAG TPA: hypothetical protein VFX97_15635 [Pyrinomonadaceae bacterium]|nr:hypothetical protein [Pyrinomonadaceae bacterium]
MKVFAAVLLALTCCCVVLPQPKIVTAAQANGTYRYRANEIKILALGNNKLRIQMDLAWEYKSPNGPTANVGQAHGEATIENDVATFRPEGTEDCTVTIKFLPGNKIRVSEDHMLNCGWGFNVSSTGTYRKTRAGKPKFDEDR